MGLQSRLRHCPTHFFFFLATTVAKLFPPKNQREVSAVTQLCCVHVSDFASAALIASSNTETRTDNVSCRSTDMTAAHHWKDSSSLQSASAGGENLLWAYQGAWWELVDVTESKNYMYALHTPLFPGALMHRHLLPGRCPGSFFLSLNSAARE